MTVSIVRKQIRVMQLVHVLAREIPVRVLIMTATARKRAMKPLTHAQAMIPPVLPATIQTRAQPQISAIIQGHAKEAEGLLLMMAMIALPMHAIRLAELRIQILRERRAMI